MKKNQIKICRESSGFTLIEVLIVTAIFSVMILAYLAFFTDALVFTRRTDERRITVQKAISMMEEVRAFVDSGLENQMEILDDFDDGDQFNPILTLAKGVDRPDDDLSGNESLGKDGWKFYRKISVERFEDEESKDLRQVTVSLYQSPDGKPGGEVRADVSGVFRTLASPLPPTQVMDVYVIAIENVPGWWVNLSTLRPLVENAFGDLEEANPGLKFRQHWITRLSYGRDSYYRPLINAEQIATKGIDQVYFYPGKINRQGFWYYSPDLIRGQISVDGILKNVDRLMDEEELSRYPLADQFNSAMRFPDELRLFEKRQDEGIDLEPSWRLLLDDMNENPGDYRNALVINLHGELLPLPPVRNYSDAAKNPLEYPGVRVVTHPENIAVPAYQPVHLRVYPYVTKPQHYSQNSKLKDGVSILLRDLIDWEPIRVEMISGGGNEPYRKERIPIKKIAKRVSAGVLLQLEDVPLRHGPKGNRGLPGNRRLYGMEYIPAPVGGKGNFSQNLLSSGGMAKNTARYRITIPPSALPKEGLLTIETRIGENNTQTGTWRYEPENLSRTYVWIDQEPPVSEQFQFMGDPLHHPYADGKEKKSFNWFFGVVDGAKGYSGYDATRQGWSEEKVDLDIPRYYHWVRQALLKTHSVFTAMTGFSFFYVGIGGDIGSDRPNGFPDGLPVSGKAYGKRGTEMVRSITHGIQSVRSGDDTWFAKPWLGELVPDEHFRTWQIQGNLSAGRKKGQFYRQPYSKIPGMEHAFDRHRTTEVLGSASFFNAVGRKSGPFNHIFSSKNKAIATPSGLELEKIFNFSILEELKAIRPFSLDSDENFPPEWKYRQYLDVRNQTRVLETFYSATSPRNSYSSALVHLSGGAPTEGAYFVINGLSPAGETGTSYIGRYSVLTLLQGFLLGGSNEFMSYRIPQLPLTKIKYPEESAELIDLEQVRVQWNLNWQRWDYQPYSDHYVQEREDQTIYFVVKYSPDEGGTWYLAQNDEEIYLGEIPDVDFQLVDRHYDWNLIDKEGNYIFRVEAFRKEIPLHYSFHQIGVTVQ